MLKIVLDTLKDNSRWPQLLFFKNSVRKKHNGSKKLSLNYNSADDNELGFQRGIQKPYHSLCLKLLKTR